MFEDYQRTKNLERNDCGADEDQAKQYQTSTDNLIDLIYDWGRDKGLHDADPARQVIKLGEEFCELQAAFLRNSWPDFTDAVGDMIVVLVNLCAQMGLDLNYCIQQAWDTIKGKMAR